MFAKSYDQTSIHFQASGSGPLAVVFLHGWLGNLHWWDSQRDALATQYQVVLMDVAGHGKSEARKAEWSILHYAQDVKAVVESLGLQRVVLVGHSMSGSAIVEAYHLMPEKVLGLVLVDTFLNLDEMPSLQALSPLFTALRANFVEALKLNLPQFTFAPTTPTSVQQRVLNEATAAIPAVSIASLEPFYDTDMREACTRVNVPVRAINSDLYPTALTVCRHYFNDFDCVIVPGCGHYPMLEAPKAFNRALISVLAQIETVTEGKTHQARAS